ncbi:MAG: signal peptidase I [Deltaproteobacteria bacterium]|nr:signal peptidase I [Deltaproteobacteria bacterium]
MARKNTDKTEPKRRGGVIREYAESIVIAILIALFIRAFIVQAFKIPSGSMEPTLLVGDHLLVNKFIYGIKLPLVERKFFVLREPQRGDIVVFIFPQDKEKDFIKRVVGVAGDKVEVRRKKIYVNDQAWHDPYGVYRDPESDSLVPRDNFGPVIVPAEHVLVMGDNRDRSYDSRFWGFVPVNQIKGKALILYWSWNSLSKELGEKVRFARIGQLIR